ncbi:hypothetical protein AV654_00430 [Paenibacillus elgii]|uniref:Copper amine oxidase-like N-terminal domain-containing protein n=1 Tax=Paenibacillus elgii TaxID=189691 RepID=A0A161SDF2_9BACL|nr:stalk domain-containing protein [Paenibacillus elgii]KZE84408.1 hypothetical protein AV654_00430 [Paenibacillus elgii]
MNKKTVQFASIVLFVALTAAYFPTAFVSADQKDRQKNRYERAEHEAHEQKEHDEQEHAEKKGKRKSTPAQTPASAPITAAPAASAGFSDNEKATLALPDGNSVSGTIRLKQGELFIPLNSVLEALQVPFVIYPKGTILEGFADGKQFIFHADKRTVYADGQRKTTAAAVFAESNQFYVPLQSAADVLGYSAVVLPQNQRIEFQVR